MRVPSVRIHTQRNQKPAFERNFSVQKLSKAIINETAPTNSQYKLAQVFKKNQTGSFEDLKKTFSPDDIEIFVFSGVIKRNGQNWKKTELGDKFISQFYREPTPIEKLWERRLASIRL